MNDIPVILVTYNRPWHTAQVLKALLKHNVQNLYIFSDAPRAKNDIEGVAKTRELFKCVRWTKPEIIYHQFNQGLAKSIVGAVNHVFKTHDRLILLEDDCVPQDHFFDFMQKCLALYERNEKVFGINGYTVPIPTELLREYPYDLYFYPRIGSWGWATWKRAWQHYDTDLAKLKNRAIAENIDLKQAGEDIPAQIQRVLNGELDAWTLNWVLAVYLNRGYYIYPTASHIRNIGFDGSGVHCGASSRFETSSSDNEPEKFPDNIVLNEGLTENYNNFFKPSSKQKSLLDSRQRIQPAASSLGSMPQDRLSIVHINTHDVAGGAAKVGWRLAETQRQAGHNSRMLVGSKKSDSRYSFAFDVGCRQEILSHCRTMGKLYYEFDGSHKLVTHPAITSADIVHLHNLHGYYFNPFSLSGLSHVKPTVWTLHDMQAFTGHCAYSLECPGFRSGCQECPHLDISPELPVDSACELLADKKMIYDHSHLWLVTPSQWLKSEVEKSVLGVHSVELIYNGIDTSVFRPYEKKQVRKKFGIPADAIAVGAVANGSTLRNPFKGGQYSLAALNELQQRFPNCVFVNIGGRDSGRNGRIINIPRISDESELAKAYSALDIFLYTPLADNCPLVVLEALSCGLPVTTFGVGGVPELVRDGRDGYVTRFKDVSQIVQAAEKLVLDPVLRAECSRNARESAVSRFDHRIIARQYEDFYRRVLQQNLAQPRQVKQFPLTEVPKIIQTDAFMESENIKKTNIAHKIQPMTQNDDHFQPEVSIVLCTKNRAQLLDKMLISLAEAAKGICYEVIVIEGGSDDDTMEVLQKHGVANIYVEAEHFGPGGHSWPELYNFGFSKARGKWAMYASDDIVFGKGCISRGLEFLNQQKDEVAGGIFFYRNLQTNNRDLQNRPDWDKFGIDFTYGSKLLMNYGLIRLDYFREVGGLDTAYKFYCADGDLCFKLYENGKEFIPLPGCFVVHDNALDVQRRTNLVGGKYDIELYKNRWKHFVSVERSNPQRLLWHEDIADALAITKTVPRINIGLEYFWHGLSCWQYRMFPEAKLKFLQALNSGCDHWQVLWYLARAASECGENQIVEKAVKGVLHFVPDFGPAKDMLHRLGGMTIYEKIGVVGQKNNRENENDTLSQIKAAGLWHQGQLLRLHLGCGKWRFDGYVNIDYPLAEHNVVTQLGADLHADITKLSFPAKSVDEIRLHHVFEHFNRVTALGLLLRWHEWLKPGGRIHIETPDLVGSAKTLLSSASWKTKMGVIRHLAGDQAADWAYHLDHWFGERFEYTLKKLGFGSIQTQTNSWSRKPFLSNIEVIAVKQTHLSREQLLNACDELLLDSMVADTPNERKMHQIWKKELREFLQDELTCCEEKTSISIAQTKETVGLIFSKDRAMQLAATLESFMLHCRDCENIQLRVLYKASDDFYQRQYDRLKSKFNEVLFIRETDFKQQSLAVVNSCEHILFMVDDNIFVKDFYLGDVLESLRQNESAVGFSLRIGRNTRYSYARDMTVTLPAFHSVDKGMLEFDWTNGQVHFGYPLELSSSVYRSDDIMPLLNQLDFSNPNTLEGLMAANAHLYGKSKSNLLCYESSVTFCNTVNMVQMVCNNRVGSDLRYSAESLSEMFQQDHRIDVRKYSGFVPNSCHQEVELKFRKAKAIQDSNTPLVSVEMVTYNAEKYLRGAIESILAQTYRNFELLIVDDGSTDNTRQIVESFSDSRIRYLYKAHKNRWAGTNYAITHAKGKYILAVDSDDSIAPDYIEKMIRFAQQYPEVDYFYPWVLTIVDGAGELTGSKWEYIDFSNNRILPNCLFEMLLSPIPYPGSLRRISMFEKTGGYEELENVADFVFLCKNALKINFKRVDEQSVYFYRTTGSGLSHRLRIRNQTMANTLNDMVRIYPPEVLCPQLASVDEPALKQQRFYKYLMTVFYRHVDGHMVQFGEYFKKYGDFYKSKLMECASRVNRAASAVSSPPAPEGAADLFEQGIKHLKRSRPNDALTCFNKVIRTVGQMPDLHYARAVALLQSGRIYDAQLACHAELYLRKDHQGAKKLLDRISRSREACKIG